MNNLTEIIDRQKKEIVDFIDGVRKESYEYGAQNAIRKEIPKFAEWICKSFDIHRTYNELIDEWLYTMAIAEKTKGEGMSNTVTMPATVDEWQRDMKIAYESGREERAAEIIKAIEEIRDCGFWCMHDLCDRKEPTAYDCEVCALDYVIKRIKEV